MTTPTPNFITLYQEQFQQIWNKLRDAKKIGVIGTVTPDGDSLGAELAISEAIRTNLHKDVDCIVLREVPNTLRYMPGNENVVTKEHVDEYDVIVAVDCGESARVPFYDEIVAQQIFLILLDHHEPKEQFGNLAVVDERLACTGQLLYYLFTALNIPITNTMATNLLTCISYDTGNFQHANTTPEVLRVAAEVSKNAIPLAKIARSIYRTKSLPVLRLWGRAMQKAHLNPQTGMVTSIITDQDLEETGLSLQKNNEDIKSVVDLINTARGSRFTLLLRQQKDGGIRASLRSEEDRGVDVSRIARMFGGGGHKLSSGFGVEPKK